MYPFMNHDKLSNYLFVCGGSTMMNERAPKVMMCRNGLDAPLNIFYQ